jgi:glycosyltransferase involved in cell wall biosynthesis
MQDLTIVTCDYNTPNLIKNLRRSIRFHMGENVKILVINTSTINEKYEFPDITQVNISGLTHGRAVNIAMGLVDTRYMLLIDSDVLILNECNKPYNRFLEGGFALMGNVSGDRGGKKLFPRVDPWFCFMDLHQLKNHDIKFFDEERTKKSRQLIRVYDVGSTMFEDVMKNGLLVANVQLENKYFKHYEGMSWRTKKYNPLAPDTDIDFGGTHNNKQLYEYGLKVEDQYEKDILKIYENS